MAKPTDGFCLLTLPAAGLLLLLAGTAVADDCTMLFDQARKTRDTAASTAAFKSCGKLSAKGDLTGRYLLGLLTIDGIGTAADANAGLKLVHEAADGSLAAAQARLGRMYLRGEAVKADPAMAADWFQRAANGGDPLAQYELGQLRYKGIGIDADPYEAYKWFTAARRNFEQEGNIPRQKLAQRKQETVAADLSSSDRERAEAWIAEQPGVTRKQ
jgi:TPR repeat protein